MLRALFEIQKHIKKNSDLNLMAGKFYFKADDDGELMNREKPVLIFAS